MRKWKYCWFISFSFTNNHGSGSGYRVIENNLNLNKTDDLEKTINFLMEIEQVQHLIPIFFKRIKPPKKKIGA
jgi:hypothetical protein